MCLDATRLTLNFTFVIMYSIFKFCNYNSLPRQGGGGGGNAATSWSEPCYLTLQGFPWSPSVVVLLK